MSKSKSTTLESPPKFLQDKPEPEPAVLASATGAVSRRLARAADAVLRDAVGDVLAGMLTMITPEGAIGFNQQTRCFQVAIPEPIEEENGESDEQEDE